MNVVNPHKGKRCNMADLRTGTVTPVTILRRAKGKRDSWIVETDDKRMFLVGEGFLTEPKDEP